MSDFDKHVLAFSPTHIRFGPIQRLQSIRKIINFWYTFGWKWWVISFRDYLGLSDACSYDVDDVIGRADRFGFQNFCSPGADPDQMPQNTVSDQGLWSVFGRAHWGSTVGLLLLQRFRVGLLLGPRLVSSQWWILIYIFAVLIHWWVEVLHAVRTTSMCIWTTSEPRVRFLQSKTGLSPQVIYYWIFQGDASVVVYSNLLLGTRYHNPLHWRFYF